MFFLFSEQNTTKKEVDLMLGFCTAGRKSYLSSLLRWQKLHATTQGGTGMSKILVGTSPFGGLNLPPLIGIGLIYLPKVDGDLYLCHCTLRHPCKSLCHYFFCHFNLTCLALCIETKVLVR